MINKTDSHGQFKLTGSDRSFYYLKFNFWLIYRYPIKLIFFFCINILHYEPYKTSDSDYNNKPIVGSTMDGDGKLTLFAQKKNLISYSNGARVDFPSNYISNPFVRSISHYNSTPYVPSSVGVYITIGISTFYFITSGINA